jgi:hypothetical protein
MLGQLPYHVAQAQTAERLRSAHDRRASRVTTESLGPGAHERQRTLVLASLLVSRRADQATSRRWA